MLKFPSRKKIFYETILPDLLKINKIKIERYVILYLGNIYYMPRKAMRKLVGIHIGPVI